jgi:hypothetical protein
MSALEKEDFLRFADSPYGSAIYNDWRALLSKVRAVVWSDAAADAPPPGDGAYRPDRFKYVDKTEVLHDILSGATECMFVTAPRRMGKSTMLSMLEQMAQGNWEAFPPGAPRWTGDASDVRVIRLDFGHVRWPKGDATAAESARALEEYITERALHEHGIDVSSLAHTYPLAAWIEMLVRNRKRVVVLVDEYDQAVVDMALNDGGDSRGPQRAEEFAREGLKPFFAATKGSGAAKVIVVGVSNFALNTIGSGANHFRHAFHLDHTFARAIGYTPDELAQTYGEAARMRYQREPEGAATASVQAAVDYVKRHGNGWCLEGTATIELLSPYVVNIWLRDADRLASITEGWAETGTPGALVALLRTHAALLLGPRRVWWSALRAELPFVDYFSASNVDQLGFQFGYLSIAVGSREEGGAENAVVSASTTEEERRADDDVLLTPSFSVLLRPPNQGVTQHITRAVEASKFVDMTVARDIKNALTRLDWEQLREAITRLSEEFARHNGRPFDNERELHMLAAAWATLPRVGGAEPLFVDNELRQRLTATEGKRSKAFDSFFSWQPRDAPAGCFHAVLVEWGFANRSAVDTQLKLKIKQIETDEHVKRATEFHRQRTQRRIKVVTAIAVVGRVTLPAGAQELQHEFAVQEQGTYTFDVGA